MPEALPAVVTISLALGVQRLVRRGALMRRLAAVETLGSTSVICSDKTGTLTRDEMTARQVYVAGTLVDVSGGGFAPEGEFLVDGAVVEGHALLERLLRAAVLSSDARVVREEASNTEPSGGGRPRCRRSSRPTVPFQRHPCQSTASTSLTCRPGGRATRRRSSSSTAP